MGVQTRALARPQTVSTRDRSPWMTRLAVWWVSRVSLLPPPVSLR
jgi:hypothetical protein